MAQLVYLRDKRIIVTGGGGFLGSYIVQKLLERGVVENNVFVPRSKDFDFVNKDGVERLFREFPAEVVIHAAGEIGGIGANVANPATFFHRNLLMGVHLIDVARKSGVKKFVTIGTTCSYPHDAPQPLHEDSLWEGYPAEATAPYGLAKRMLIAQSSIYRCQYGFNSLNLIPTNLYGPGDHFDLERSHVLPALIRRCVQAKEDNSSTFVVWGSGRATRDFIYVEDAAEGIVLATEKYNKSEPVNLGSGIEVPIRTLAEKICDIVGFTGSLVWDTTKPDGTLRRCLATTRAEREFRFRAKTSLDEGLRQTIQWYLKHRSEVNV